VVRELGEVLRPLLEEGVPTLLGLVGAVGEAGRLAGEHLLADQAVVDQVEGELQHPLGRRALGVDGRRPLQRHVLEPLVVHHLVDGAHAVHRLGVVLPPQEEDLPGELLAHLAGQVRGAEAPVEAGHVGIGLLEACVLTTGQGQVGHHVQAVATPGRPARHHGDHHLRHEPDESLYLEDVEASRSGRVHGLGRLALGVPVAVLSADALVAAGAERPATVPEGRTVAGEEHRAHVRRHPGVVQHPVQLVDRVRPEGVADLRTVEGDSHRALVDGPVVREVGQLEPGNGFPAGRIEGRVAHGLEPTARYRTARKRSLPPPSVGERTIDVHRELVIGAPADEV